MLILIKTTCHYNSKTWKST